MHLYRSSSCNGLFSDNPSKDECIESGQFSGCGLGEWSERSRLYDSVWRNGKMQIRPLQESTSLIRLRSSSQFECCGRTSPQDYVLIERTPPATCFKDLVQLPQNLISDGCRILVEDYFNLLLFISNVILCLGICVEVSATILHIFAVS